MTRGDADLRDFCFVGGVEKSSGSCNADAAASQALARVTADLSTQSGSGRLGTSCHSSAIVRENCKEVTLSNWAKLAITRRAMCICRAHEDSVEDQRMTIDGVVLSQSRRDRRREGWRCARRRGPEVGSLGVFWG